MSELFRSEVGGELRSAGKPEPVGDQDSRFDYFTFTSSSITRNGPSSTVAL